MKKIIIFSLFVILNLTVSAQVEIRDLYENLAYECLNSPHSKSFNCEVSIVNTNGRRYKKIFIGGIRYSLEPKRDADGNIVETQFDPDTLKGVDKFVYDQFVGTEKTMSQIAGRLSIQEGAKYLEKEFGGRGVLLGGVPGVERGKIVIIGGGIAGTYAAKAAVGIDAQVTLLDINPNRLAYLEDIFGASVTTLYSTEANIRKALSEADLVIGSVLVPGASTPKLVRCEHLKLMKKGAVIVDIAIDQGGCCESSHVTVHDDPIFIEEGVVHYCVGNMPGAVPHTSTVALANATIKYGLEIAHNGLESAVKSDKGLLMGVNIYAGKCVNMNVAKSLGLEYTDMLTIC